MSHLPSSRKASLTRRALLTNGAASFIGLTSTLGMAEDLPEFASSRSQFIFERSRRYVGSVQLSAGDSRVTELRSYRGKAVLVAFWASWCPPCRTEMPILGELQTLSKSESFAVAPVSVDVSQVAARRFLDSLGLQSFSTFIDQRGSLRLAPDAPFPLYGMPMSYVIDRSGHIAGYMTGAADWTAPDALQLLRYFGRGPELK